MISTLRWEKNKLKLIDQTELPLRFVYLDCADVSSIWKAIYSLKIRGAPAIGVAAGFGVYLGIKDSPAKTHPSFKKDLGRVLSYLATARPTAVNLFWVLERMRNLVEENKDKSVSKLKRLILAEAKEIMAEERKSSQKIAFWGNKLIRDGDRILTYCNTGRLATVGYGTALGAIHYAKEKGKRMEVF
ncbi:MAG: S-methyl-5-thioribose-1-phosphate isomerase, partial [Candidatus Omnitrophota bacterium]